MIRDSVNQVAEKVAAKLPDGSTAENAYAKTRDTFNDILVKVRGTSDGSADVQADVDKIIEMLSKPSDLTDEGACLFVLTLPRRHTLTMRACVQRDASKRRPSSLAVVVSVPDARQSSEVRVLTSSHLHSHSQVADILGQDPAECTKNGYLMTQQAITHAQAAAECAKSNRGLVSIPTQDDFRKVNEALLECGGVRSKAWVNDWQGNNYGTCIQFTAGNAVGQPGAITVPASCEETARAVCGPDSECTKDGYLLTQQMVPHAQAVGECAKYNRGLASIPSTAVFSSVNGALLHCAGVRSTAWVKDWQGNDYGTCIQFTAGDDPTSTYCHCLAYTTETC